VPRNMSASIMVPHNISAGASHPDRPPYASSNIPKPIGYTGTPQLDATQQSAITEKPVVIANENIIPASMSTKAAAPAATTPTARVTMLVLKSNQVLEVTKYRIDGGVVTYQQVNGTIGAVDTDQIDWLRTTQMTAAVRSVDLPVVARQTN